ncbi:unnamed protein product [Pedinophyceae sp. YPF-701]|nr:unnamed protein product [Pedinophyceae sp. YPF-701]
MVLTEATNSPRPVAGAPQPGKPAFAPDAENHAIYSPVSNLNAKRPAVRTSLGRIAGSGHTSASKRKSNIPSSVATPNTHTGVAPRPGHAPRSRIARPGSAGPRGQTATPQHRADAQDEPVMMSINPVFTDVVRRVSTSPSLQPTTPSTPPAAASPATPAPGVAAAPTAPVVPQQLAARGGRTPAGPMATPPLASIAEATPLASADMTVPDFSTLAARRSSSGLSDAGSTVPIDVVAAVAILGLAASGVALVLARLVLPAHVLTFSAPRVAEAPAAAWSDVLRREIDESVLVTGMSSALSRAGSARRHVLSSAKGLLSWTVSLVHDAEELRAHRLAEMEAIKAEFLPPPLAAIAPPPTPHATLFPAIHPPRAALLALVAATALLAAGAAFVHLRSSRAAWTDEGESDLYDGPLPSGLDSDDDFGADDLPGAAQAGRTARRRSSVANYGLDTTGTPLRKCSRLHPRHGAGDMILRDLQ